ncbi:MAG: SPOR domain-containing protein [Treponema sp.]|nr:SPOR domain-containing protein [Treponema sp.]
MKNKGFLFLALLAAVVSISGTQFLYGQTGTSLEVEIQNIEASIVRQGIPPAERHSALVRLATLKQLSGDIEGAAKNWLEAAAAIPGRVDDEALLSCAYCLAAMGEWDRAATALESLLSKSPRARFLDLSIKAIRTGDTAALAAIADNVEYSSFKAEILFVLWKISSRGASGSNSAGERWRQRLVSEFPQTPEGRLAAGVSSSTIVVRPSPFWLFAGGLDSLPLVASASTPAPSPVRPAQSQPAAQPPVVQPAPSQSPVSQQQVSPVTAAAVPAAPTAASAPRLQTGIYSQQANAQTQVTNLRNAGFTASIERRLVNNSEMWAVTVPVGANQTQTVNALRAAGFDSFLVR